MDKWLFHFFFSMADMMSRSDCVLILFVPVRVHQSIVACLEDKKYVEILSETFKFLHFK